MLSVDSVESFHNVSLVTGIIVQVWQITSCLNRQHKDSIFIKKKIYSLNFILPFNKKSIFLRLPITSSPLHTFTFPKNCAMLWQKEMSKYVCVGSPGMWFHDCYSKRSMCDSFNISSRKEILLNSLYSENRELCGGSSWWSLWFAYFGSVVRMLRQWWNKRGNFVIHYLHQQLKDCNFNQVSLNVNNPRNQCGGKLIELNRFSFSITHRTMN